MEGRNLAGGGGRARYPPLHVTSTYLRWGYAVDYIIWKGVPSLKSLKTTAIHQSESHDLMSVTLFFQTS